MGSNISLQFIDLITMSYTDRFRQPEYTGENRCTPCTAVNIVIAAVAGTLVATISMILGAGVFALSLGTIYFRGYLVPGTPSLTKRYFPERVLRWFDKDSAAAMTDESVEIDPERLLLDANTVEPCREGTDLCLTSEFRDVWREHIHDIRAHDPDEDNLAAALSVSPKDDQFRFDQYSDAFVAHTDDAIIGQWSSQAAILADVAAATELNKRVPSWSNHAPAEIARVLMSLRIFIQQCPDCGGPIQVEQEVVESCCRSYDVVASACQDCDARLLEMEWDETSVNESPTQENQSTQAGV